jgi:hypothetical protein
MCKNIRLEIGFAITIIIILGMVSCRTPCGGGPSKLEGVWHITEIEFLDGSKPANMAPLPSLVIFTPHHYSMVWLPGAEAPRAFAERWHPTDIEKIARYDAFIVNTGTYEVLDTILTMHPIVARVPEFMGGRFIHSYTLSANRLQLRTLDEYSYDDVQAPWVKSGGGERLTLARVLQ